MSAFDYGQKLHSVKPRWAPSDAVLRTPSSLFRSCSTTQQPSPPPAPPPTPLGPRWLPQSAQDALQRLDGYRKTASANTPEQVKQLAAAAKEGKLFRVAAIQSNNLWLRFGGVIVAVAFAGGTYTLYRTSQSVYTAVTGIKDNGWTFRIIVCTFNLRVACLSCSHLLEQQCAKRDCSRSRCWLSILR